MTEASKVLEVVCPTCGGMKNINVPAEVFSHKKFGTTIKIQIPAKAVCSEHQFLIFVDIKGKIRGYEPIDIQMVSITRGVEKDGTGPLNLRKLIQIFGVYGILSLIHAKIFNYPTKILVDDNFEYNKYTLNSIFNTILPEKYRASKTISLLERSDFDKKKRSRKNLVLDTNKNIFQIPWITKLKFEEEIIKKTLEIIDSQEQLKLLQQEVSKLIKEVDCTISILHETNEIYDEDLIEKISKSLKIKKINNYRLNLIKEFIRQNISHKLMFKIKNKVEEFLNVL